MLKGKYRTLIVIFVIVNLLFTKNSVNAICISYVIEDDVNDVTIDLDANQTSGNHSYIDIKSLDLWVDQDLRSINFTLEIIGEPDVAENREYIVHISASKWIDHENSIKTTTIIMNLIGLDVSYFISNDFDGKKEDPSTISIDGDFSLICSRRVIVLSIVGIPEAYDLTVFEENEYNSLHISAETNYYDNNKHYQDVLVYEREQFLSPNTKKSSISLFYFFLTITLIECIYIIKHKIK